MSRHPTDAKLILVLGAASALGPLAVNTYIPAVLAIGHDLRSTPSSVQFTISCFIFGMATGQLFWGPASERVGRRPPLLAGLLLFCLTSAFCAHVTGIAMLCIGRFLQGAGACAGMVSARAVVSDTFAGAKAAHMFGYQQLIVGLAPVVAPGIGALVLTWSGWRPIFWLLCLLSGFVLLAVYFSLPESRSPETADRSRSEGHLGGYMRVLRNRQLAGRLLAGGLSASCLMTWYAGSGPLLEHDFRWSLALSSATVTSVGLALVAATQLNRPLLRRWKSPVIVDVVLSAAAIWTGAILLFAMSGLPYAHATTAVGLVIAVASYGLASANNQACTLELDRSRAGTIAALIGASNFGIGALFAALLSALPSLQGVTMLGLIFLQFTAARAALWATKDLAALPSTHAAAQ